MSKKRAAEEEAAPLAREQVRAPVSAAPQVDADYNIWYGSSRASRETKRAAAKAPATTRCCITRDSGRTKGGGGGDVCLFFARGCCHLGWRCSRLHRAPRAGDVFPNELDCFGRRRDAEDAATAERRGGRRGEGPGNALGRASRTLWIGGVAAAPGLETARRPRTRRDANRSGLANGREREGGRLGVPR